MFTGLVEELGEVIKISRGQNSARLTVAAEKVMAALTIGDSIAVNGACQTVVGISGKTFTVEAMAETLDKTNLGGLAAGNRVNLERALRTDSRLGGHLVSGHVDAVGTIKSRTVIDIATVIAITAPEEILRLTAPKGSIAIDGISLTVVDVTDNFFSVSVIPHTAGETTLGFKKEHQTVNLEVDILARYIDRLLQERFGEKKAKSRISMDFLKENGFV